MRCMPGRQSSSVEEHQFCFEVLLGEYEADKMDSSAADYETFGWEGMMSSGEQFQGHYDYYDAPGLSDF